MKISKHKVELLMAKKQLSQKDLAADMGVAASCVGGIIRRQTAQPSTVGRLAAALGVPVENILEG